MTETDLINLGVTAEHIQFLKDTKILSIPMEGYYYDVKKPSTTELVPVQKIVGLGARGEKDQSWWKHFSSEKGNLTRILPLKESLYKIGLNSFRHTFQQVSFSGEIEMEYYADIDIYFVNAGQHRATMAKVTDATYMLANVSRMEINKEKEKEYYLKIEFLNQIEDLLEKLSFRVNGNKIYWEKVYIFQSGLFENFTERPLLTNTVSLKGLLERLESFAMAVREVEDIQKAMSNSRITQYKFIMMKKFGLDKKVNNFEKLILELQSKGWKHSLID